jgi:hypothetical protein
MRDNGSPGAARIDDLGPGDFVKVDYAARSHTALLSTAFLSRLGHSATRCWTSRTA